MRNAFITFLRVMKYARKVRCIFMIAVMTAFTLPTVTANAHEVTIGVLAKRGDAKTMQRWSPVASYLTEVIPGHHFTIVPLTFKKVLHAVRDKRVDFIFVNPSMYVQLENTEQIERIATLKNDVANKSVTKTGGVVFVRNDHSDIQSFEDLEDKKIAAVDPDSFGGWITALREFHHAGINPDLEFAKVDFLGTHDAVVFEVINGHYDAGIIRTSTLERMAREGKLQMSSVRHIKGLCEQPPPKEKQVEANDGCPFIRSTVLYPEWPMARLPTTPVGLSEQVAIALISMPQTHPAAIKAKIKGWTIPANYQPVHDAMLELRIGPYEHMGELTTSAFAQKFKYQIVLTFCTLLILTIVLMKYVHINSRLKDSELKLKTIASHDALTNLPNRHYFEDFAEKRIYSAERKHTILGLLFVDLDGFKQVNDTLGHTAGDAVLIEVAKRLQSTVRKGDLVARCGGDEFLVLMVDVISPQDLSEAAQRILHSLEPAIATDGTHVRIGASIGIAHYPQDGSDISELLKKSDDAMYQVKASGRGHYRYYSAPNDQSHFQNSFVDRPVAHNN